MFIHDTIKIKYSREGFLPDYPYHLISDEELFEGFINEDRECFFYDTYPCPDDSLKEIYDDLVLSLKYHLQQFLDGNISKLPNWVYSYMIGAVVGPNSDQYDIHDLLVLLNLDNVEDEIRLEAYQSIYEYSQQHVRKLQAEEREHRPPTFFGEPHVIKLLRLEQTSI